MAKKEAAAPKAEKKTFLVADLAEALGKEGHEVRGALRKAEIEKVDGKYQWEGQKAFDAVVKQLKGAGGKPKVEAEEKSEKKAPKNKAEAAPETKGGKKERVKPNK